MTGKVQESGAPSPERGDDVARSPAWRRYLRFFRADPDGDVEDEIRTHLALRIEDNLTRGMSDEDARREALERFGDLERVRAECRALGHEREQSMRRRELFGAVRQDLRFAARTLRRAPAFTAVAVASLALGIGANTAIFGLVDSLVLRPLPGIANADGLVQLDGSSHSYPAHRFLREELDIFAELASYRTRDMSLATTATASPVITPVGIVTANYFDVLGTRPALGRTFLAEEGRPGSRIPSAVLSHGLWTSAFGADSGVLGHVLRLNGASFIVVGIAPKGFRGTRVATAPSLWIPVEASPLTFVGPLAGSDIDRPGWSWMTSVGRLRPGITMQEAEQRMRAAGERQEAARSLLAFELAEMTIVRAASAAASVGDGPGGGAFALLLFGVVGLTLLIACTNVAGLVLARSSRRGKEISVRLALGASRGRLMRQLLTESLVLGAAGAIVGALLASVLAPVLASVEAPGAGRIDLMTGDLTVRMLAFAALLGVAAAVAVGLLPAMQASRPSIVSSLKDLGTGTRGGRARLRASLVVAQLALSLVLLAGAGLFIRSLRAAVAVETGYRTDHVALLLLNTGFANYDENRAARYLELLRERLQRRPGIEAATWAISMPLVGDREALMFGLTLPGTDTLRRVSLAVNAVGPDFFRTLGVPLLRGRDFDARDRHGAPLVAIVNETMAGRYWPDGNALGARMLLGRDEVTIIGVARDARYASLDEVPAPHVYFSTTQQPEQVTDNVIIFARGQGAASALVPVLRAEARSIDGNVPVLTAATFDDVTAQTLLPQRVAAVALSLFGTLTLLLSAIGVYGVMAYLVAQRTRELGIRMALGATASDVLRLVLGRSLVLVIAGMALGLAMALAAARVASGFLFGVTATDPWAFGAGVLLLGVAAIVASVLPAGRAARIPPTVALRAD